MKNEFTNTEHQPDEFSLSVRKKLENHQLAFEPDLWDSIQKAIEAPKKRRIPLWWWMPMGSVAVVALILMLRPVTNEISYSTKSISKQTKKTITTKQTSVSFSQNSKSNAEIKSRINRVSSISNVENINSVTTSNPIETTSNLKESGSIAVVQLQKDTTDTFRIEPNKVEIVRNEKSTTKDSIKHPEYLIPPSTETISKKIKENNSKWLLAASFASSSRPGSGFANLDATRLTNALTDVPTNYSTALNAMSFTNITYNTPLSFGFSLRKPLNNTFSAETGLVYTYLVTNYNNPTISDARKELHYLGIPVNLIVNLLNLPKWEIYVSGGGMIEKGIRSYYTQHLYYISQTNTTTTQEGIDGIQLSLNTGAGVSYKIYQNLGIYFEPKLSYFFDNNQPISIRTNQPVILGLNVGLRYQLK